MNTNKDKFPDIVAELKGEHSLDRAAILDYCKRLSDAWKREKDATRARIYRFNKKSRVTQSVTDGVTNGVTQNVTESVTNSVTQLKEERSEKENLPPTPPYKRKSEERRKRLAYRLGGRGRARERALACT